MLSRTVFRSKAFQEVPISLKDLPPIDFVCVTHNHYDHLDYYVTQNLPSNAVWIVPEGLKTWFNRRGVTNVVELNWWDKFNYDEDVSVTLTPCQHWTKRNLFGDTNTTLWGSFFIKSAKKGKREKVIDFSGDTGYCDAFKETRSLLGDVDFAFLPIGAYGPQHMRKAEHLDPFQAVQVHKDLGASLSIGMHWGTFVLSKEPVLEPRTKLKEAIDHYKLPPEQFVTFSHGETRLIKLPLTQSLKSPYVSHALPELALHLK